MPVRIKSEKDVMESILKDTNNQVKLDSMVLESVHRMAIRCILSDSKKMEGNIYFRLLLHKDGHKRIWQITDQ